MAWKATLDNWGSRLPHPRLRQAFGMLRPLGCFNAIMARQGGWTPGITLSFDCDFPRDIQVLPRLLALLERYHCHASFACIGQWIRAYPDHHRDLVAAGHEILNHSETHPNLYHPKYAYARQPGLSRQRFNQLDAAAKRDEIRRAHQTCVELLECTPVGFRTPHFGVLHTADVYPLLAELGYRFSSSTLAADTPAGLPWQRPDGIWEFPLSPCPAHPFGVFDSWHSLGKTAPAHAGHGQLGDLFATLVNRVARDGGYVNVYFDPCDMLESGAMEQVLQCVQASGLPVWRYAELLQRLQDSPAVAPMGV